MFDTFSFSFLNFLFPMSFLLNSLCWCQNHVQHLPLYFSLLKKKPSAWDALLLTSQSPISHFLYICALFLLHLCPLLLRSIWCHQTPSFLCFCPFIFISLNVPILPFLTVFLKFAFSRKFLSCNLNQCTQCAKGRMISREVRGLVKGTQSNPNACYGTLIRVQWGFVKGLHESVSV